MSRQIRFDQCGPPEVLYIKEYVTPSPKKNEVCIDVKAIGATRADSLWRSGLFMEQPKLPASLGYDCVGLVHSVGSDVSKWKVGDRVGSFASFSLNNYSTYADQVIMPESSLLRIPENISWEEAAAIPTPFMTAYLGLIKSTPLSASSTVLISASSSSVGVAAILQAKGVGSTVIAVSRTSDKKEVILELGADYFIAMQEEDLVEKVREYTNGLGVDIIFDAVAGKSAQLWLKIIRPGGEIVIYGLLDPSPIELSTPDLLSTAARIYGFSLFVYTGHAEFHMPQNTEMVDEAVNFIMEGVESGLHRPRVAKVFSFEDVVAAHHYIESSHQIGRIILRV